MNISLILGTVFLIISAIFLKWLKKRLNPNREVHCDPPDDYSDWK